jgi:hypothetical protein
MNKLEESGIDLLFCEKCEEAFWDFGETICPNNTIIGTDKPCGTVLKHYSMIVKK